MEYMVYNRYKELGGTLPETTFDSLYSKIKSRLDYFTFERLKTLASIPVELENCIMELMTTYEMIEKTKNPENGNVSRESANGYDVTYGSNSGEIKNLSIGSEKEIVYDVINIYLINIKDANGIPVLYRGV